ncbi:ribulose-phosphate 3-epimerase [Neoactinobaculum massilliense]|uniref:ribulose-phosphate 3-epimerase n=1 Tax=Neoactinobaculum massilliense TaxID=2364794 RepID=UPI000F52F03C|nr:ribulose-phosphate 3-epimerase [Neoactinobaculum massilliense]
MSILISPSVLNCDFGHFAAELDKIKDADWVHVDIMDNHFVPNLALGMPVFEAAAKYAASPLDAHLMIEDPDTWAPSYAEAGAASVTFHVEAAKAPIRLARELHAKGVRVGLGLRPATDITAYADILGEFDQILVMTVEPGFGGQKFLSSMLPKIRRTRKLIEAAGLETWIQVDGGISQATIASAAEAGANNFVAGSAVFKAADAAAEIGALRSLATEHSAH